MSPQQIGMCGALLQIGWIVQYQAFMYPTDYGSSDVLLICMASFGAKAHAHMRTCTHTRLSARVSPLQNVGSCHVQTSDLLNCVSKRGVSDIHSDGALCWPKAAGIESEELSSGEPPTKTIL